MSNLGATTSMPKRSAIATASSRVLVGVAQRAVHHEQHAFAAIALWAVGEDLADSRPSKSNRSSAFWGMPVVAVVGSDAHDTSSGAANSGTASRTARTARMTRGRKGLTGGAD